MEWKTYAGIFLAALLIALATACVRVGEMVEETHAVQKGSAELAEVKLKMAAGVIKIQGGTEELLEADFRYNVSHWKPELDYHDFGNRRIISIRQNKSSGIPLGNARNIWNIRLNKDIPVALEINFGAGECKCDLRGLNLRSLDIDIGAGEVSIDLTGEHKRSLDVEISSGVGSATIYLPENTGVRVKVDKGIGSVSAPGFKKEGHIYTNDAFGKTEASIAVEVDAGIGGINLKLK